MFPLFFAAALAGALLLRTLSGLPLLATPHYHGAVAHSHGAGGVAHDHRGGAGVGGEREARETNAFPVRIPVRRPPVEEAPDSPDRDPASPEGAYFCLASLDTLADGGFAVPAPPVAARGIIAPMARAESAECRVSARPRAPPHATAPFA